MNLPDLSKLALDEKVRAQVEEAARVISNEQVEFIAKTALVLLQPEMKRVALTAARTLLADETAALVEALTWALDTIEHGVPEAPKHSCGPESGCDADCMDYAYWSQDRQKAAAVLRRHKP